MSKSTKISLVALALAGVGLIVWRRHMSTVTDAGTYSPSHNLGAASTGLSGSLAVPPAYQTLYGGLAKQVADYGLSPEAANAAWTRATTVDTTTPAGMHPGPPPTRTVVAPSTGPATETRSGRGHF